MKISILILFLFFINFSQGQTNTTKFIFTIGSNDEPYTTSLNKGDYQITFVKSYDNTKIKGYNIIKTETVEAIPPIELDEGTLGILGSVDQKNIRILTYNYF